MVRQGLQLKGWYSEQRTKYTVAYAAYAQSGQNDPANWPNFSNGNAILDYWFALGQTHPGLCESELKLIPVGAAHSNNGKTKGGKKRSRAKDHKTDMEKEKLKMAAKLSDSREAVNAVPLCAL